MRAAAICTAASGRRRSAGSARRPARPAAPAAAARPGAGCRGRPAAPSCAPLAQPQRQLAGGGGLAGALQADHQDRRSAPAALRLSGTAPSPPSTSISPSLTILTTCWPGETERSTASPIARSAHLGDEVAHHRQRDVGLEQRDADLAQRLVDVLLGQHAAAAQPVEDAGEPVGQCVEHKGLQPESAAARTLAERRTPASGGAGVMRARTVQVNARRGHVPAGHSHGTMAAMSIEVIPTGAALGAEIRGVDLAEPIDGATFAAIERAFDEHGVIFFRDQLITPPQQVAFTRRFGDIEFNIFGERWSVPGQSRDRRRLQHHRRRPAYRRPPRRRELALRHVLRAASPARHHAVCP